MQNDILDAPEREREEPSFYFNKPGLMLRIKSMLLDSIVIIAFMASVTFLLESWDIKAGGWRIAAFLFILFYEPVLTSSNVGRTIGQTLMGLQVQQFSKMNNNAAIERINFPSALIRYATKLLLGWISLITITSDKYGRALHDKISGSVVTFWNK